MIFDGDAEKQIKNTWDPVDPGWFRKDFGAAEQLVKTCCCHKAALDTWRGGTAAVTAQVSAVNTSFQNNTL